MKRHLPLLLLSSAALTPALLHAQPPGRGGPPGRGPAGPPPEMILRLFDEADVDQNGSVTKAELTDALEKLDRGPQGRERGREGRGGPPRENRRDEGGRERRPGPPRDDAQRGPDHRGDHGHEDGHHEDGHQGPPPPPRPGQIVPEPVMQSLDLNDDQTRQLSELQADVDQRLASILTDEQMTTLREARPPRGPEGRGGPPQREGEGDRDGGRPRRPR